MLLVELFLVALFVLAFFEIDLHLTGDIWGLSLRLDLHRQVPGERGQPFRNPGGARGGGW